MSASQESTSVVKVRRIGSDATHLADLPQTAFIRGEQWGVPVLWVDAPVATRCRAVLRGRVVRMQDDQRVTCHTCNAELPPPYSAYDTVLLRAVTAEHRFTEALRLLSALIVDPGRHQMRRSEPGLEWCVVCEEPWPCPMTLAVRFMARTTGSLNA